MPINKMNGHLIGQQGALLALWNRTIACPLSGHVWRPSMDFPRDKAPMAAAARQLSLARILLVIGSPASRERADYDRPFTA